MVASQWIYRRQSLLGIPSMSSRSPLPLIPITTTWYQALLRCEIESAINQIKTFDLYTLTLTMFHWYVSTCTKTRCTTWYYCPQRPVIKNARVHPNTLLTYCQNYQFQNPCCLCPLLTPNSEDLAYREVTIDVALISIYTGEYIAECTRKLCGYIGNVA